MTATPTSGLPAHTAASGVPATHGAHGGPPAAKAQPKRSGAVRRFVVPLLVLAALGYGGKTAYDYFVEGRFLVTTDDAYVGASTSIIAAKATGHLTAVPVVDNQVVHQGDLLASIDDGDYQNAVEFGEGPHRHPGRDDRPLRPADRRAGRDHRPGRGPGAGVRRRSFSAPRPMSSGPRSNTTVRSSSRRRISARSSGSNRRPPIAPAPPPRLPEPGRAPLRPSPRSTGPRPISTSSRPSATKRAASAANSRRRSPRPNAICRSPASSRLSTASSATRPPRSAISSSRARA